jgi:hypothetical protein
VRATGPPFVVDDDLVAHDPRVPVLDGSRAAGEPVPTNIRLEETTSKPSRASTCRRAALGGSSSNAACTVPVDQPAPAPATNWCAAGPSAQRRTGLGRTAATSTQTFQATGGAPPATSLLEDTETQVSDLSGLSQRRLPESDRLAVRCPEEPVRRSLPFAAVAGAVLSADGGRRGRMHRRAGSRGILGAQCHVGDQSQVLLGVDRRHTDDDVAGAGIDVACDTGGDVCGGADNECLDG